MWPRSLRGKRRSRRLPNRLGSRGRASSGRCSSASRGAVGVSEFASGNALIAQLRDERLKQGIPQSVLSTLIGGSKTAVTDWEAGRNRPRLDLLVAWAQALGLEIWLAPPGRK